VESVRFPFLEWCNGVLEKSVPVRRESADESHVVLVPAKLLFAGWSFGMIAQNVTGTGCGARSWRG
jgi:hypothetical protein